MNKDPDYIFKLEKAVAKKYGEEAIQNPKSNWNDNKEQEFNEQRKNFYQKLNSSSAPLMEDIEGFKISKKLLNKDSVPFCPVCYKQTSSVKDDVMIVKYECCNNCFVKWVDGREERWKTGWRPAKKD